MWRIDKVAANVVLVSLVVLFFWAVVYGVLTLCTENSTCRCHEAATQVTLCRGPAELCALLAHRAMRACEE